MHSGGKALEQDSQSRDALCEGWFLTQRGCHPLQAVDHGGVITSAERGADLDELKAEELPHQIHGDLPRSGECLRPGLRAEASRGHSPFLGDWLLNRI